MTTDLFTTQLESLLQDNDELNSPLHEQVEETASAMKPKRKGTPRARITEGDAKLIAFTGAFPCADAEALSIISTRQANPFGATEGELTSIGGAKVKLKKIEKLGGITKDRHPGSGEYLYSITEAGIEYCQEYGYDTSNYRSMDGLALTRLNHYRRIATVAAQFASPEGYFKQTLGLDPIPFENLVSEQAMREAYEPLAREAQALTKEGKPTDFGTLRTKALSQGVTAIQAGDLPWDGLLLLYPEALTLGFPQREGTRLKRVHQPDLAVIVPGRNKPQAENLLVEIELSKKTADEYDRILATLKQELAKPYVYSRAVYFTIGKQVENVLRKVDRAGGYDLFTTGKLTVLPITDRDGTPISQTRRVHI